MTPQEKKAEDFDKSREEAQSNDEYTIEDGASEVQRGYFSKPSFYNDVSLSSSHSSFMSGVQTALNFAGNIARKNELVQERNSDTGYRLTEREYNELVKKASSIAAFSNIPQDICEDFLIILCFVDNITDMRTIADAVQVPELADPTIIQQPLAILSISRLEKVAFAASAIDGLINMFKRFLKVAQYNNNNSSNGNEIGSILNALGGIVSGLGGATARLNNGSAEDSLGNFLSELITGKRIPMTVIAKNPMLQSPSYTGKAFFGESPNALSNVDIDQLFCKKIAAFPRPSSGSGTTSFGFQNMGSFGNSMSVQSITSKILTGSTSISSGSKKERQVLNVTDKINTMLGTRNDEVLDLRRADTAIPFSSALSTVLSNTEKSEFSSDTFQNGWTLANSMSNHLLNTNPNFIEAVRRFF